MSKLTTILLLGGGYLAWRFWQIKQAIDLLQIKVTGVNVSSKGTGLLNTVLQFTLSVYNPSNTKLSFQQMAGVILYQGREVAYFNVKAGNGPTVIAANGVSQIPLDASIENINALSALPAILQNGIENIPITIQGTLTISSMHVPVSITLND